MDNEKKIYAEPFTLDGRVKPVLGVTKAKAAAVSQLVDESLSGNRMSRGVLEEALSSTDAIFNFAHVTQLTVLQDFPTLPRNAAELGATTLTVQDFRPATLYSLRPDWSDGGTLATVGDPANNHHVAPRVPEAANYPYAYLEQEVSQQQGGIVKRGFKTGFTFEAFINDSVGFIQALPGAMSNIALDTDEWELWNALVSGVGTTQQLAGGTIPDTTAPTVVPNAPISREAIMRAIIELSQRRINGRRILATGGFKLVIPVGTRPFVDFLLNNALLEGYQIGATTSASVPVRQFSIQGYDPIGSLQIIESEYIANNAWYLIPNDNQARRPLLQLLRLAGHELPELRVQGNTGSYTGGGAVSPFEGSFDNDTADFRLRMFTKGILWTPDLIVWSDGGGVAH